MIVVVMATIWATVMTVLMLMLMTIMVSMIVLLLHCFRTLLNLLCNSEIPAQVMRVGTFH
jgi:hypothetical protein